MVWSLSLQLRLSSPSHKLPHLETRLNFHLYPMSSTGSWKTQEVHPRSEPQQTTTKEVTFGKPFVAPPRLPLGFNELDLSRHANIRVIANAENITKEGFTASLNTWGDSILHSAGASWFELAPGYFEYQNGEFSTEDDHPWDEPQRETSRRIYFARPFITPPKVIVFLKELHMDKTKDWRVSTKVSDIDVNGLNILINTWGDSILYSAAAGSIAYPSDRPYVFSCTACTGDVRHWSKPQHLNNKSIGFDGVQFWRTPSVFMAIKSLAFSHKADLRIKVRAKNVTATGLTWHLKSWGDSIFTSGEVSILAVA